MDGGAQRMYRSKLDFRPGPGDYKLPPSIGGNHPWYKSAPVYSAVRCKKPSDCSIFKRAI